MPSTSGSSKPSTLARRTKVDVDSDILTTLTNPSKCDDQLARRLARALNITEQPVTAKAATKGKQKLVQPGDDLEDKRRLAMRAANVASQSLGKVVQSGWKASNHKATPAFSMNAVLSIVSSFRMAIKFLREAKLSPIEVERVASGFVGKLIAVQLYEPALELLDEIKVNVIRSYKEFAPSPSKKLGARSTKEPSFTKYMHLVEYPQPAPEDPILLGLIGTSLSQAITAVTAVMQPSPPNPAVLEKFVTLLEGNGGPISWHSSLAAEHADALLARVHRAIATTFTPSNAAPKILLGLRSVALRCLLYRITLDRDSFWTQATNYMASHGKSVIKSEEAMKAVDDVVAFFNGVVAVARARHDAATFMSGSPFIKFCEVALVFAKRGNMENLNVITQFIHGGSNSDTSGSTGNDLAGVKLHATLSSAVVVLENQADGCPGSEAFDSLSRCTAALSKAAPTSTSRSDVSRSLERLRRACGKAFDNASGGDALINVVKSLLVVILGTMENCMQRKEEEDFSASIVDSLCTLAKVELVPSDVATHMTSYDFLQRAVTLVDNHCHDPEGSTGNGTADSTFSRSRIMRVLAGAFWNNAVVLYQDGKYAVAVRFLVQACELTVKACDMLKDLEDLGSSDPRSEPLKVLKSHLPKRWELLGDCYSRIGERRLAHRAFLKSLTTHPFDILRRSAAYSSPDQLSSEATHRRVASLVERITSIAVFDLLVQGEASLRETLCEAGVDREAVGIILEWQATCLDESSRKDDVRPVLDRILRDAADLYGVEFPIRRVRVLLRQLDLAYRSEDLSIPVFEMAESIQDLLSQDAGKDAAFADMQSQYKAVAHMWVVFHAHRRSQNNSHSTVILHHATQASKILRCMFPPTQVSGFVKSPKNSPRISMSKTAQPTTRTSPRKRKTATTNINPVTPKPRKIAIRTPPNVKPQIPSASKTPPKPPGSPVYPHLITNIQMMAQLMGLLGHIILKIQFLNILQRMTERSAGPSADDFVRATVDAANEYLRLGKTQRSMTIYGHALAAVSTATTISDEVRVTLLLHYAASHALNGNAEKSSSLYEEARHWSRNIECRQTNSTAARIRARVLTLEHSALASNVFSAIQIAQDDPHAAFSTLRKALRLWNRAFDTLARLSPPPTSTSSNPFDLSSLADALPVTSGKPQQEIPQSNKSYRRNTAMDGLQWRIAEGLLHTLFGLGRAYFLQGTVRGAEYYIEQARDLAASLNSPTLLSRALAKKGELQLHQGKLEDAATTLMEASHLLHDLPGIDAADISRLRAHHSQLTNQHKEAKELYSDIVNMLSALAKSLIPMENGAPNSRRSSLVQSPGRHKTTDVLVPGFLANVLRQQIWLQRNEPQTMTKPLLEQMSTLPPSRETKAEELAILAKLALHDANVQFGADLFLSSLTESTIALPMGTSSHNSKLSPGARQMLETLSTAEKMFWASLEFVANRGQSSEVREAAVSLALIQSFQTTLGKSWTTGARVAAGLLDASAAITLRRELIDEIEQKYPELMVDDLVWPTIYGQLPIVSRSLQFTRSVGSDDDSGQEDPNDSLKAYWRAVRDRYYSAYDLNDQFLCTSQTDSLPENWTVVNISITEDKTTMFFSRQRCGKEPLIFCVPLERHGRKEEDEREQFAYGDAVGQLKDILQESDMSAEAAKDVPSQDRDAKVAWWAKRAALDKRMRDLLENIEFCWLGAFKTILSEPVKMQSDILNSLRVRFEKLFKRSLGSDKKRMPRVHLDDALMECFASLSPRCRDEELEDLVYFILDLYQFHGVHIALSEIDMDQLTVELRTALEEHAVKAKSRVVPMDDPHLFLVLDKNVQGIPWESIPILRGRSVSRIPSLSFLVDRIELAKLQRESLGVPVSNIDRAVVNPKKTFYVLNPGGDLTKSESRFGAWVKEMEAPAIGWQGIVGRVPSEQELLNAFSKKDLFIYFGHGGAEQYVRSHKIKQLQRCAATMLWGCSSGLMREMGEFDRVGTPYNYMLAGCPTLVACLWDVTDNELDKISRSVFDKLRLNADHVKAWNPELMDDAPTSLIAAVGQSRDACKLKYLTGAAPVVYGIPFYL